jgi:glycosyltransferase involved in cell wall biosynthesis
MLISIGILAHNEAENIEATLVSLFQQTALRGPPGSMRGAGEVEWEIVVVPNGCTDDTASRARATCARELEASGIKNLTWRVEELEKPGKSNAWNRYVHELSAPRSELIVMLDADIRFGENETIANTIAALLADPAAVVAVDLAIKDAALRSRKSLLERISVSASKDVNNQGAPGISGQFFCARAAALRAVWMPNGLSVEDGFLYSMIVTDGFRSQPDVRKVIRAPGASHYYETLTSPADIFRHELRLVIGTTLNCYLTWDFLYFATDPAGTGAGPLIANRIAQDPDWYRKLMANSVRNHGWWVLPRGTLLRRLDRLKGRRGAALLKSIPVAMAGLLLDLPVFLAANRKLKRDLPVGYW